MPDPIPKLLVSERLAIAVLALGAAGCVLMEMKGPGLRLGMTAGGMTPWAAFSVLLLGVSLALLQWPNSSAGRRVIAVSTAVLMVLGNAGFGLRVASATPVSLALMTGVLLVIAFVKERRSSWRAGGLAASLLLVLLHGINLLGQEAGVALLADAGAASISWMTSATLIALNLALLLACGVRTWIYGNFLGEIPGREDFTPVMVRRQRQQALAVFVLIVGLSVTVGYTYLRRHTSQMHQEVATQLTEVAELKVAQIEAWRRERLNDARTLASLPFLTDNPPALGAYLDNYRRTNGYQSVVVVDRAGAPVLASPAGSQEPVALMLMAEAAHAKQVLVEDLHRAADGMVRMSFIAPLRSPEGEFTGAILLRMDAGSHLYPILRKWPLPSDTAETILVRREGLSVVFLNNLRFHPNAALKLRFPLGQPGLAASKAVIEQRVDLSEGVDYRGEPVLWLARPISDSPWVMVAKLDQAEAYAVLRAETWRMAGGFVLGLLAVSLLVGNYWRNRQRYYEQQHQDTERERQTATQRLALIMRHAKDVILLFDEEMRVVETNERALAVYGRTPQEMRQLRLQDLRTERARGTVERDYAQELTAESLTFETEHRRKDGTVFPVEVSSLGMEIKGRRHLLLIVRDITEGKLLMQELQISEARYRDLFENMDLGVIYQDPSGAITAGNAAASRILGLSLDQLQGRKSVDPGWHAVNEDGRPYPGETHPAMVALRTGQRVQNVVMGIRTTHQATRWILIHAMPEFRAGESQPFRVFTIFADITERRASEDKMRKLSLAVEQSPVSIVITDLSGAIEYVNSRFTEVSGYTREEVLGRNPRILKSNQTAPEVYEELWRTITRGAIWRGEMVNRRKDGELFTELVIITPVKDAQGRPTHYLALKEEITERKRTEQALRDSEAKFRQLMQMMPLPISHTDKDGRITFANDRFQKIFGYDLEDVPTVQAWWEKAYPDPAYRAAIVEQWTRAIAAAAAGQCEIAAMETSITCKDGRVRIVEISGILLGEEVLAAFVDITVRVKTERKLRLLTRTIEQAPLIVVITDCSGAIEYVNPRFCEVTGYTQEEVIGQNPRVLKSGDTPVATYTDMWQTLVRGQVWRGELCNKKKNGELYYEQAVIAPVTDDDGVVTHYVGIKEDVTEHRRNEAALRETRERYRIITENTNDTIWLYDLAKERFTYCSPSILKLRGYTPEEILTQRMFDSLTPESAAYVARAMPDRLARYATGELSIRTESHELEQVHRDGRIIPTEVSTTLLGDATGRVTQILGVTRDITERRKASEALRRSEELYRLIADNTSDAIWICDLQQGLLSFVSPAAERLLGIPLAELIGQPMTKALTPESAATVAKAMPARIAAFNAGDLSQRDHTVSLDYIRQDGSILHSEVVTNLLPDDQGRATRMLGVSRDVTERFKAEQALNESRDRLAKAEQIARLGNWSLEVASNRVIWSDEMYQVLELDPATTVPSMELYNSFLSPEDQEVLQRRYAEALAGGQRFVLSSRLSLRNGRIKHVDSTGEVLRGPDGKPVRVIGTVQDVTDRRLIEIELHELVKGLRVLRSISQALQQREQSRVDFLALVVRELPAAMAFPADARALIEIDGQRQAAGAGGKLLARLTVPITLNNRAAGAVTVGYVRTHATADEGPFRVRERDVLESIARAIGLGLGEREALNVVQRFNTELEGKVAERTTELAARTKQIEALLNAIPDTVMRLRLDGSVQFSQRAQSSPRLAAITPLPALRPGYRATTDLLAACVRLGRQALAENNTIAGEVEVGTPGGPIAIELRSAPTGTEEFVLFVRDITARKRLEAEVAAMLEKERELSEMKTRFISVTSHEFRTPMAAAMGSVELLHNHFDRLTPAKREELFTRVYGSMHRMTEMLDDVLTLNRMDANRLEVQPSVVDLRSFVHSAMDEIHLGDRGGHRFELDCEGETAGFVTDPNLLHHILSNLLSNAVRYSPAGTTVTTRVTATATTVTITVADQGIGIPESDRQRIFEPFERGSNIGQIQGTGLGLNIVMRMSQLLGGTIGVEKVAGGGSCFILTLSRLPPPGFHL